MGAKSLSHWTTREVPETNSEISDFTYSIEENMLSEGISMMEWEYKRRRIHSAWKDQGKFNQKVLVELTLREDDVENSRREKQSCKNM